MMGGGSSSGAGDASNPGSGSGGGISPDEMLICFCHGITEAEIRAAIKEGARTVAEIQAKTLASTGCGGCMPEVERILEEVLGSGAGKKPATD
ncbi:MAG: (2Fe-2S)-binding protein [Bdellovibrionota bacterium]